MFDGGRLVLRLKHASLQESQEKYCVNASESSMGDTISWLQCVATEHDIYHRDSRQEFAKVGGIFPILHVVFLLEASN